MKANVRHQQKAIFSIKKYLPIQSIWYLAVLKTLNTPDGVILTLSYPENIIFLISLHTIKGVTYSKWKLTPSKTKHLSMSLLAYKEVFSLFHLIAVALNKNINSTDYASGIRLPDCSKLVVNWEMAMTSQFFEMRSSSIFLMLFSFSCQV